MVLLGLELEKDDKVRDYINRLKEKVEVKDLTKNPYTDWVIKDFFLGDSYFVGLKFDQLWVDFSNYLILPVVGSFFFMLVGLLPASVGVWIILVVCFFWVLVKYFRSKYFNFFVLRFNLRRLKYKGKIRLLSTKKLASLFPNLVLGELNGAD